MDEKLQFYIDGRWVDPVEARPFDVIDPATEAPIARIALGSEKDVDLAVSAARRAFRSYAETTREDRIALLEAIVRCLSEALRRDRHDDLPGDGRPAVALEGGAGSHRPRPPDPDDRGAAPLSVRSGAGHDPHPSRTRGRVRLHHAVELAGQPDHVQGGAGAGRRLHDGPQADGARAPQRTAPRRGLSRGRRAGRRLQSGEWRRSDRGPGDRLAPRRRHGVVHRIDACRDRGGARRRLHREARDPGTGRQVREHHPRRRRLRYCHRRAG